MGKIIHLPASGANPKVAAVDAMTASLQAHLNGIAGHFADPKITLVVRTEQGGDLIMTNDTAERAIEALAQEARNILDGAN